MSTMSATFAMGCFWSPDARFGSTPGVLRTRVGYTGGTQPDPTYKKLGDHTESVQVDFDAQRISYVQLLNIFWTGHNPMKPVWGPQYMSAIFYHDAEQERLCMDVLKEQTMNGRFRLPTQICALDRFYQAEAYHQKYYLRQQVELAKAMSEVHRTDEELIRSTAAARVNGALAGFAEPTALEAELEALAMPSALSQRIVAIVRRLHEHGRRPHCA
jgi:methionine-S-sulfoxide reductase